MSISSRIHDTIEEWTVEWRDRLAGWVGNAFGGAVIRFLEILEPEGVEFARDTIDQLVANPDLPDNIRSILSRARGGSAPVHMIVLAVVVVLAVFPAIQGFGAPISRITEYATERIIKSGRLPLDLMVRGYFRGLVSQERLVARLQDAGLDQVDIEAFIETSKFYPGPADLVHWQAREVFEPSMISKYGLDSELGDVDRDPFYKAGMTDEQITNYWRAHWEHASWIQIVEMLYRGLLEEDEVYDWFRLVEIPPFWRDKLIQTAYTWPTRVDVRRWWDLRTIDEEELRRLYKGMGYRGVNLDNYVLWTKVYVAWPDLIARFTKGWITEDEVREELVDLGMPPERVEELIQTKVKAEEPERTVTERDVTKTDIYKGVKQGVITRDEGLELLQELGYSEDEADYLLTINIPEDQVDEVVAERELTKTDIKAGIKQGVLTEDEAREKLLELRYNPADVEFLLEIYKVVADPPEEVALKEASKADIVKGVKKGLITHEEGHAMLLELGYSPDAADFILTVQVEESPFSPKSFEEFKEVTYKYRRAAGVESKPIPEEIKAAADNLVKARLEVDTLEAAVEKERGNVSIEPGTPEAATEKLKQLEVALNRARAELERIQLDYNTRVTAWRRGVGGI